ncbi:YpmS family protein [Aquibacillus salsiterrae]|uniref:YpmS family protein n=1 Tax=Aquibacillus salsiterrae TaxID=2950439 RepID=A0A9X4AHV9_9BACI|nr:YpmS family protein [Aquibacillus salsiterrae]MDC3418643.1 YpmS family protein [Aquibacillus salsiterrae]
MKSRNWKVFFLALLGINMFLLFLALIFVLWPVSEGEVPDKEFIEEESGAEFTVQSSKENLSELVNAYIDKLLKGKAQDFAVDFSENVHLMGSIEAFQTDIPISITLEPDVQENGDIILHQKKISIGLLDLPNQKVLQYLKKSLPVPEWVVINPKEENIYIAVTQMKIKSNFKVKVQQFDLKKNNISFRIKVPNETLGL